MRHICPFCGGKKFITTAHVCQEWLVDENGNFIDCVTECTDVTHRPDDDNTWTCSACGKDYPSGKPFYFTFGWNPEFPYQGTYLIVFANDHSDAIRKFRKKYPDRPGHEGTYNAAFSYSDEEWAGSINEQVYGLPVEIII